MPEGQRAMTADILRDYMMGRLSGAGRARVRDRLRVDPEFRGTLRRLRDTTVRIRARLGRAGTIQHLPVEWLPLVERIAQGTRAREAEAPKNWSRSGTSQRDERTLTWL
jgi:hypothetical protein